MPSVPGSVWFAGTVEVARGTSLALKARSYWKVLIGGLFAALRAGLTFCGYVPGGSLGSLAGTVMCD